MERVEKSFEIFKKAMKQQGTNIRKKDEKYMGNDGLEYEPWENEDGTIDVLTGTSVYYRIENAPVFEKWHWMVGGDGQHTHLSTFRYEK